VARLGALLALLAIQPTAAGTIEEVVVSASRIESDASLEALSIARIDAAALQRTGSQHVSQAFFQVPGGWVSRGNGQEHLTAIRSPVFTGPGACGAFLMTEDLIPLRAAGFCNVNQLFDANTEQAERIEVLRGPGTAVYGSNAVHGVINVLTPEPAAEPSGRLGLELGPDQYGRVKLTAHSGGSNQRLLAMFNSTHDGGYQADSGFKQHKWTLRHATSRGPADIDSGVSGSFLDQQTAGFIQGPDAYRDGELRRSNPNPEAYREAASLRAWSRWRGGDGADGWLLTPYLRWNDMEFLQHFLPWKARERNGHWSLGLQSSVHRSWGPDWRLSAASCGV
jgi:outer membrane receptor protein involved in Fe transport